MSSTIKLKKSSIAGRVPSASDLEYGEIAINIADGKLYFKNSSNIIQSFEAGSFVDSAAVLSLIDSSYIRARQIDEGLDSAEVNALIASGLQNAFSRILVDGQFDVVSDSTQDGLTFAAGNNITITTAPNDDTITFTTSAIGADSVTSLIDSSYVDLRLPTRMVTLTDSQELSNKTLAGPVLNSPVFGTGTNSPTFTEIRFNNSNIMKFNQMYTGASSGSYFSNGEYQKVATITPDGNSQNYQVVGRITAQNAGETHTVYFNAALRSNTLPDLNWSITYNEEYTGNRYIDPQLWTKETTTAGFIFAFKTLATIYGTVTVDFEVIPRTNAQLANVTVNSTQNSEQSAVDTGFTARDMTRTHAIIGNNVRLGAYTFPTADGNANQVLGTNGSGTLQFVNQTEGLDSGSAIALIDSAYVQARQTAQDFAYGSLTGVPSTFAPSGVDSAATIALIDSAYVQARQVDLQRDSAFITGLIDSSYIQARDNVGGTTVTSLNRSVFTYTTTSNQTVFTGADSDGNTLAFNDEVDVYLNGILLKQSDYVLSGGNTVTLDLATSAGNILTVVDYGASIATLPSQRTYEYTATANQTTFTGSDDNGNTLSYDVEKLNVYVNGILLATEDYTATNTTSVVLTTGAAVDDIVQVVAWKAAIAGELDSDATIALIDSAYIQARQLGSEITIQDEGSSLSTAATTLNFVGSAVTASGTGTTKTITITQAEGGTDSATVSNIVANDVDSAYVQARQSTTDLTNYRTVTQIESMIDSNVNAVIDAAPGALNTLNELAAALGDDANFSTTVTNSIAAKIDSAQAIALIDSAHVALHSAIGKGDIDFGSNKITYSNVYSTEGDLPSASTYHGMFAHVHATGAGYFAHGGNWIKLANQSELSSYDSNSTIAIIDSAYVVARNGFSNLRESNGTLIASGNILPGADSTYSIGTENLKFKDLFLSGGTIYIDDLGLSANNNGTITIGQLDSAGFTPVGTIATVDSTQVGTIVDSAYLAARLTNFVSDTELSAFGYSTFDSTNAVGLIDSAYVQARQNTTTSLAFSAITSTPTTIAGYGITDAFDGAYGSLTGVPTSFAPIGVDSNATFAIIDSAYVQARQSTASGFDSASAIGLIDSNYIQIRQSSVSGGATTITTTSYIANFGDTSFAASYTVGKLNVYLNGILLVDSDDYTATSGSSVVLTSAADSADVIQIVAYTTQAAGTLDSDGVISLVDSAYVNARVAAGTDSATVSNIILSDVDSAYVQARQSTTDLTNYRTVTQIQSMIDSEVNGLVDAAPGALNTLNELAAALGDDANFSTTIVNQIAEKVDSDNVIAIVDSAYVQARQTAQDFAFSSLTGTPTTIAGYGITDAFDGAYGSLTGVPSTFTPTGVDSSATISLIDSAYIQARQTNGYSEGTVDAILVDGNSASDTTYDNAFWTAGSDSSGAGYNQGGGLSWNSTNGKVTVSSGGLYEIKFHAYFTASGGEANHNHRFQLWKNGSNYIGGFVHKSLGTSETAVQSGSATIPLSAGDYIQIKGAGGTSWRPRVYGGAGHTYLQVIKQENGVLDTGIDSSTITSIIDSAYVSARAGSSGASGLDSAAALNLFSVTTADPFAVTVGADSASFDLTSDVNHTASPDLSTSLERNGLLFSDDGGVMYIADDEGIVHRYTLSTAYDPEAYTETHSNYIDLGSTYQALLHRTTGGYVLSTNYAGDVIRLFTSSDGFDTFSYVGNTTGQIDTTADGLTTPISAQFNADGTVLWVYDAASSNIGKYQKYTLSTAYDLSTASYQSSGTVAVKLGTSTVSGSSSSGEWFQFAFNNNGKIVFEYDGDNLALFRLATAYDLSSAATTLQIYDKSNFIGSISNSHTAWQWVHTSSKNAIFTMPRNYNNMVEIPLNYTGSEGTPANPASLVYSADSGVYTYTPPKIVDSADVISLIDSAYIQARQSTASGFDSNSAIGLIDSSYVQARQNTTTSLAFSAITSTPTTIAGYGITDALQLGTTSTTALAGNTSLFDGAFSSLTGTPTTLAGYGITDGGGTDSASVIALIDSSYVAARTGNNSLTVNYVPDRKYARLTMSSNQTGISSTTVALTTFNTRNIDTSPNNALTSTLADGKFIIPAGVSKIKLSASCKTSSVADQVTMTFWKNGTFFTGASNIDVSSTGRDHAAAFTGIIDVVENDYFQIAMFSQNSRTAEQDELSWFELEVIEGSMLNTAVASTIELSNLSNVDSASPSNGQALVWDSDNSYWKPGSVASSGGTDSAAVISLIDSSYIQARQTNTAAGATTISTTTFTATADQTTFATSYTVGKINTYLNGVLLVDSADYTASNGSSIVLGTGANADDIIQVVKYTTETIGTLDSAGVTNLIDSNYIQARQSASSGGTVDSADIIAIVDSNYVQARQSSTDLTNYRTVTQIESMIDSNVNAVIDAAPGALNTLNELAAAIGDDANFSTTVTNSIAAKLPLAGGTMSGNIDLDNNELLNINYLRFNDPGVQEGIGWEGGNGWQIFESPDNMTNASGNLQFTTGSNTSDRMMTIDTNGNLELPTGRLTQISDDPLRIRSSTNASPVKIEFSDLSTGGSYSQKGTISYTHSDAASTSAGISGANEVFIIEGTETVTGIKLDGRLLVTGTSEFEGDVDFGSNQITYSNVYSTTSDLPSASTYHGMFAHVHATGKGYFAHGGNWVELANHSQLANSSNWDTAYGWGNHASAGYLTSAIDSSGVISLIDSSYVQARQSSVGSGGLDSSATISLIDSAYVQARQTSSGGGSTVDSADIIAIVDSDYIQARQSASSTTITTGGAFAARTYHYTASANQTTFSGADDNGDTLAITDSDANVYLNGILLMRTTDYTVGSNSITLQSGADSDNIISIVSYTGQHLDSNYILSRVSGGATTTTFTATANQTVFSGGGFTYKPDNLTVFYNGILLLDSDDYTATDGTRITLTSGATAGHKLTAVAYTMGNAVNGVDVRTNTFTATDGQTVFNNLDDNGNRLSYNVGNAAIYLNGILLSPADYTANNSTRVVLTEAADSGNVLTVMSYAGNQQTVTADSSSWYEVSTTTYNAAATDKLFVDVSSAAATVTLPTSPSMGDEVRVIDATGNAATNNITIGRNGSKINGADSDLTLDIDRAAVGLVYYNAAQGWILMER